MTAEQVERAARAIAKEFDHDWVFDADPISVSVRSDVMYDADMWRHIARKALTEAEKS